MAYKIRLLILGFVSIAFLFLSIITVASQQKITKKKPNAEKSISQTKPVVQSTPNTNFLNESFQTNIDKLPPNFQGHDIWEIIKNLERRIPSRNKSEFETTEQYKSRIEQDNNIPLFASITINSTVAIVGQVNKDYPSDQIRSIYNADKQIMAFKFDPSPFPFYIEDNDESLKLNILKLSFQFNSKQVSNQKYDVTSLFGKKVLVNETTEKTPYLLVHNWQYDGIRYNKFNDIEVKLTIDRAILAKTYSQVLFIGKLINPLLSKGERRYKPTLKIPTSLITIGYSLHFQLKEIWIFNEQTGEIYKKFKLDQEKELESTDYGDLPNLERAKLFYKGSRDDEAMIILKRILNSDLHNSEVYLLMGKIYLRQKDYDNARSSLRTAIHWENNKIEAYILLCQIFLLNKNCSDAKNYYQMALKIEAENNEVISLKKFIDECK